MDELIRLILCKTDSSEKLSKVNRSRKIGLNKVNKKIIIIVNKTKELFFKNLGLSFNFLYFLTIVSTKQINKNINQLTIAIRDKETNIPIVEENKTIANKYLFINCLKLKTKIEDKTKKPPNTFGWEKVPQGLKTSAPFIEAFAIAGVCWLKLLSPKKYKTP